MISGWGVEVDLKKIEVVVKCETPKNDAEYQSFLELVGYYCRFVEGFSLIVGPLTKLFRKNVAFEWSEAYQKSFDELKTKLTTAPVLTILTGNGGFVVYSDASHQGLGCVLMQHGKVIAYASRQLRPYEFSYKNIRS